MNYIKEMNAFYVRIETNPLTVSATVLWHALMHINNRAGWKKEFTVAATVVCGKTGLPPSTFKRARNELRDKGYITYRSRGTLAPVYRMSSLTKTEGTKQQETETENHSEKEKPTANVESLDKIGPARQAGTEREVGIGSQIGSATGLIETGGEQPKQVNEAILSEETLQFYRENFGMLSKHVQGELAKWARWMSDVHVYEALLRAVESGNITWNYAKGILNNWNEDELYTIMDVLNAEREFRNRRKGHTHYRDRVQHKEVIPDWFHTRKRKGVG